jgi:hypothetical protein
MKITSVKTNHSNHRQLDKEDAIQLLVWIYFPYWDNTIYHSWNCMVIIGSILGYNMVIFPFFLFPNNLLFLMNACFRFWFSGFDDICAGTLCYVLHQCRAHSIKKTKARSMTRCAFFY